MEYRPWGLRGQSRARKMHKHKYHLCSRTGIRAQTFRGQILLWKKTKINENIHGITIYSCFVFRLLQYNNNIHVVYRHNYSTDISITVKKSLWKSAFTATRHHNSAKLTDFSLPVLQLTMFSANPVHSPPVPSPFVKSPPCIIKSFITLWNLLPL